MRTEYVIVGIVLMLIILVIIIAMLTGAIPGFEEFIRDFSENPWKW
jgi:hypothetical protein